MTTPPDETRPVPDPLTDQQLADLPDLLDEETTESAPRTGIIRFARMAGSSIAGRDAAPWVTDFLNAAYYRRAGADIEVPPLEQKLRGRLLTGGGDRFLHRDTGATGGTATSEPLWWPSAKVSGKYLSPYLAGKGVVHLPSRGAPPENAMDVEVDVTRPRRVPGGVVESALRPITPLHPGLRA